MSRSVTETGGRAATDAVVPGKFALSVGRPNLPEPAGFRWIPLGELARLESGHTPSRARADYWDGEIPWIGIRDATENHGLRISDTKQHITDLGLANSSARLLPAEAVCLSRTASVGYVVIMGRSMATSQDFVNWVCGDGLSPSYLRYLLMAEQDSVKRFAFGSVHQTMYYPDAKALYVCVPSRVEQRAIAEVLGALDDKIAANAALARTAEELALAFMSHHRVNSTLGDIAVIVRKTVNPEILPDVKIEHYSLPAYDVDRLPAVDMPKAIKSTKFELPGPCVLVSKLNPRFPRVWPVLSIGDTGGVASTEFMPVVGRGCSPGSLWSALAQPSFGTKLESQVAGTSGSHQRVRPEDILGIEIHDPRELSDWESSTIDSLVLLSVRSRVENRTLAKLRDTLLPGLMSGRLRVQDAERQVGEV